MSLLALAGLAAALPALATADTAPRLEELVVTAPLDPDGQDAFRLPAPGYSVDAADLDRSGSFSVQEALGRSAPGVSLSDVQGSSLGQDVVFRGFRASPLQGVGQGLAVYLDGVRLNEAFGDTVNWDLLPQAAIRRMDLVTANPAFGLNAIGGAVAVRTKTGFDETGGSATFRGGAFGTAEGALETTVHGRRWSLYLAADGEHSDGWRLHSPSDAARFLGDLGWRDGRTEAHLTLSLGADRIGVVGPAPADLLKADRAAVYTWPQTTSNRAALAIASVRRDLSDSWSVEARGYLRRFTQSHIDGNDGDVVPCRRLPRVGGVRTLCVDADDLAGGQTTDPSAWQVLGSGGQPIPCAADPAGACLPTPYGTLDQTSTRTTTAGAGVEGARRGALLGRRNDLQFGAALDASEVRFSAHSRLALIRPDLEVTTQAEIPGAGEVIHTRGGLAYDPVELGDRRTDAGLYARDTLDLSDRLSVTVSARFNHAAIALRDRTGGSPDLNGDHAYARLNLGAGAAWRLPAGLGLFGGYAEANRAPTPLELGCSDPLRPCLLEGALVADPPLKQVVARTWQGGLRGRHRINGVQASWTLALFDTRSNEDIVSLASAIQGRSYFANVPSTERRGLDLSANLVGRRWSVFASYSHVDATYRFDGLLASPNNPFADGDGNIHVRPGDRIGGIPRDAAKLGGDLQLGRRLSIGADLTFTGRQPLAGDEANQAAELPAYALVGLRGGWRLTPAVEVFARVDNLLGSDAAGYGAFYETDALSNLSPSPLPASPDPRTLTLVAPRSLQAGISARW